MEKDYLSIYIFGHSSKIHDIYFIIIYKVRYTIPFFIIIYKGCY